MWHLTKQIQRSLAHLPSPSPPPPPSPPPSPTSGVQSTTLSTLALYHTHNLVIAYNQYCYSNETISYLKTTEKKKSKKHAATRKNRKKLYCSCCI